MLSAASDAKKLITAEAIKNLFLGEEKSENTLCSLIDYHNVNMKSVLAQGTLKNYFTTKKYVLLFLKKRYKTNDIYLSDLNCQFITEFDFFLSSTKPLDESNPLGHNGIMKHIERLKKIARLGANNGKHSSIHLYLDRDNSGMKITKESLLISNKYIDESYKYKNHKDLNEFLMTEYKIETPKQRIGRRL